MASVGALRLRLRRRLPWALGQMNRTLAFFLIAVVLCAASAFAGAAITFLYLAKPIEQWNVEFNESSFSAQAEALESLRNSSPHQAMQYLELSAAHSINQLAKAKQSGAKVQQSWSTNRAVTYLCNHPPAIAGASTGVPPSIKEACVTLRDSPKKND